MLPKIVGFISIVALLLWMGYLVIGCAPLLILKHDTPDDWRLIRGFFHIHYCVLIGISASGALSFALSDRLFLATVMTSIALIGCATRLFIVPRMDRLRSSLTATDGLAKSKFRQLHLTGLGLDVCYLIGFLWVLTFSSIELFTCVDHPPGCQNAECRHQCSLF
jgi:hypothetical protein